MAQPKKRDTYSITNAWPRWDIKIEFHNNVTQSQVKSLIFVIFKLLLKWNE